MNTERYFAKDWFVDAMESLQLAVNRRPTMACDLTRLHARFPIIQKSPAPHLRAVTSLRSRPAHAHPKSVRGNQSKPRLYGGKLTGQ
jgi:hypothetical protein